MDTRKTAATAALALGLLAGSAGIANALSNQNNTRAPATADKTAQTGADTETDEQPVNGSIQAPAEVKGQSEADEAKSLEGLAKITADEASKAAVDANPGSTVSDVALESEDGSVVYEVTLTDASGAVQEVVVDAGNGTVLAQETDDDGGDEGSEADEGTEGNEASEADEGTEADNEANEANEGPETNEGPEANEPAEVTPNN